MIRTRQALEDLRTALEDAGVMTDPASMTDADIDRITVLAHQAHDALESDRSHH